MVITVPRGLSGHDPRPQAADVYERGGGNQLVAWLLLGIAIEESERPVGEVGGPGCVGSLEEFDDPQLGIGHERHLGNGKLSSISKWCTYPSIVSIRSIRLQLVRR